MSRLKCPACGEAVSVAAVGRPVCDDCGWGGGRPATPRTFALAADDLPEERAEGRHRRPRRARQRRPVGSSGGVPGYAVAAGLVAAIWAALGWYASREKDAAYWLAFAGLLIGTVGSLWLYATAAKEGAERLSFLNVSSRSVSGKLVLALIELAVVPVFSLVFLFFYFGVTWKPFLIELAGVGMLAHGVVLIVRP